MFRQILKSLGVRSEPPDAPPSTAWYDLPNDATAGNEPYDAAKQLRIQTTEIDEHGQPFTEIYDLQFTKSAMTLYMMFANGCYEEMRAECESVDAHQVLVKMAQNIGAFSSCESDSAQHFRLYRDGYDVYRCDAGEEIYIFINPTPDPSLFSVPNAP